MGNPDLDLSDFNPIIFWCFGSISTPSLEWTVQEARKFGRFITEQIKITMNEFMYVCTPSSGFSPAQSCPLGLVTSTCYSILVNFTLPEYTFLKDPSGPSHLSKEGESSNNFIDSTFGQDAKLFLSQL